ncbi:N-acetyltransferase [Salinisphaera sp. T31B1]|uniref:N-acetyltransferase n=1 Tax=Salinisphaera sp. T31B1 TaxID=727963 RepID=UPI0033429963
MPQAAHDTVIRTTAVTSKRDRQHFLAVPERILGTDPAWRAPLRIERRMHLSPKQNPAFEHLEFASWLAWRGTDCVGRISAQIDTLRKPIHGDDVGYFGMLDAEDDAAVFAALLDAAEAWLGERGVTQVHGPFNLTINEECGLLVDGFDTPPMVMMGHARPYYAERLTELGYGKAIDLHAYWISLDFAHPPVMSRLLERYAPRVRVRPIDGKRFMEELDTIRDLFNDAWANNWGFVPLTREEFRDMGKTLKVLLPDELVQIAEVDGEPAAFIVGLPNINEAARDLRGRLSPVGLAKLLWRLKVRFPETSRVPLMGVRQQYQSGPLGAALAYSVIGALQTELLACGASGCELSWILETNKGMKNIIESIGGRVYKTYRIYDKPI